MKFPELKVILQINVNEFLNMTKEEYDAKYENNSSYWRGKKTIDRNIKLYILHTVTSLG